MHLWATVLTCQEGAGPTPAAGLGLGAPLSQRQAWKRSRVSRPRPGAMLPVQASFLTKQPLSTAPKTHPPPPPPRRVSGCHYLGANSTRAVCAELGRQALGHQGQQNTALALGERSIRPEAALPHKRAGPQRRPGHLCGVRSPAQLCGPQGLPTRAGLLPGVLRRGPTVRGSWTRKKQDVLSPPVLPCGSQGSTLFFVFSLIFIQKLGKAGEDS